MAIDRSPSSAAGSALYAYRPALDGLRALAVLPVLLYHADLTFASGGFLGVDLFFVISGYLITTLLIREASARGEIGLRSFWARRARRLFPALFAMLAAVLVYGLMAAPGEVSRLAGDALSTLGYASNWWFAFRGESYFEQFARPSMLRHTWSLAIEEQFYIVWPLLIAAGVRAVGLRRGLWLGASLLAARVSAAWMAVLFEPGIDPSRVYYGTDTRCQALLVGVALAFALASSEDPTSSTSGRTKWLDGVGFLGLLCCLAFFHLATDRTEWMYRGGYLLMALASACAIAGAVTGAPGTALVRVLSWPPLLWIGARSYGLYLWHWPVFVFLDAERLGLGESPSLLLGFRLSLTFGVSALSYRFLESPIRARRLSPRREIQALVASVAILTAAIPLVTRTFSRDSLIPPEAADLPASPDALRVLVVGDSVAGTLASNAPLETESGTPLAVRASRILGCGITRGEIRLTSGWYPDPPKCDAWRHNWQQRTRDVDPDVTVILLGAWEVFDRRVDGRRLALGTEAHREDLILRLEEGLELLGWTQRPIFLLTVPCYNSRLEGKKRLWIDRNDPDRRRQVNEIWRIAAERNPEKLRLLDLQAEVCPNGSWQRTLDGVVLHDDGVHFSKKGAHRVWKWLAPQLVAAVREEIAP